jgi:hypothetical protein
VTTNISCVATFGPIFVTYRTDLGSDRMKKAPQTFFFHTKTFFAAFLKFFTSQMPASPSTASENNCYETIP